jgi:hypothetical protein
MLGREVQCVEGVWCEAHGERVCPCATHKHKHANKHASVKLDEGHDLAVLEQKCMHFIHVHILQRTTSHLRPTQTDMNTNLHRCRAVLLCCECCNDSSRVAHDHKLHHFVVNETKQKLYKIVAPGAPYAESQNRCVMQKHTREQANSTPHCAWA